MSLAWVQLCCMLCFSLSSCSSMITHVSVKSTSWAVCFCSDKIGELFGYHSLLGWWSVTAFIFKFRSHLQCWVSYPVMCFWLKTYEHVCMWTRHTWWGSASESVEIQVSTLLQNLNILRSVYRRFRFKSTKATQTTSPSWPFT